MLRIWRAMNGEQKAKFLGGAASSLVIVLFTLACVFSSFWRTRLVQDFWPVDNARIAPNIIASIVQAAFYSAILYTVWPKFREFVNGLSKDISRQHKRYLDEQTESLKSHHEKQIAELHAKLDAQAKKLEALHKKVTPKKEP